MSTTFRGLLSSIQPSQAAEVQLQDYAYGQSHRDMGTSALDAMQVVDRKFNELLSAFDLDKLREILVAYNQTENPGADLLQSAMQDKSPDRDKKTLLTFIYIWEKSFLALYDRGALNQCLAEDLDAENLPPAVQRQLDQMVASVADHERQLAVASQVSAVPKLSASDVAGFRSFVQGDSMGKAPASMVAIRKTIESDRKFAVFASQELKLNRPLLGFVEKYEATPSARLRAVDGKITLGTEQTGFVTMSKADLDSFVEDAVKARLL